MDYKVPNSYTIRTSRKDAYYNIIRKLVVKNRLIKNISRKYNFFPIKNYPLYVPTADKFMKK